MNQYPVIISWALTTIVMNQFPRIILVWPFVRSRVILNELLNTFSMSRLARPSAVIVNTEEIANWMHPLAAVIEVL